MIAPARRATGKQQPDAGRGVSAVAARSADVFARVGRGHGPGEKDLQLVYSLALAGVIQRDQWNSVLRDQKPGPPRITSSEPAPPPVEREQPQNIDRTEVESFLARVKTAQTHYDVLGVNREVSPQSLKTIYYQLARNYHPDRFRKSESSLVTQLEAAFARIKARHDTLRDDGLRAITTPNSKHERRPSRWPSQSRSARAATGSRYRKNG